MLGTQHNDLAAKVQFLEDQLKMLRQEKQEADDIAHRLEMKVQILEEENQQVKLMRPAYSQDVTQNPSYRILNEKYEIAQNQIKDLNNRLHLSAEQLRKQEEEVLRKNQELHLKADCLAQVSDDV